MTEIQPPSAYRSTDGQAQSIVAEHDKGTLMLAGDDLVVVKRVMGQSIEQRHRIGRLRTVRVGREGNELVLFVQSGFGHQDKLHGCRPAEGIVAILTELVRRNPGLDIEAQQTELAAWLTQAVSPDAITDVEAAKTARKVERDTADAARPKVEVKKYSNEREFQRDARKMIERGWHIEGQSSRTKHWSLTTGFLTNKGVTTVTWIKGGQLPSELQVADEPTAPAPTLASAEAPIDIPDQIAKLAHLRDSGILTAEEFDAKKQDLLARM